ncbi:hypothetical protein [Anaplasma marginale]|uniref:hypothetical protein n=1 Tax=Anaplasma marginale TaxID=770 RepID=UPI000311472C|nr:hypothetical protein [Anaplasma marginale]
MVVRAREGEVLYAFCRGHHCCYVVWRNLLIYVRPWEAKVMKIEKSPPLRRCQSVPHVMAFDVVVGL